MSCRSPKDLIKSKWRSKSSNSKSETTLETVRGKTAALQTSVDEITGGRAKLTDQERHRLLEVMAVKTLSIVVSFMGGNETLFSQ